ncbi:DbpA RNA binding domain-containing protein [Brucepastera parasyntrophica]|uniref:DbpA RNA binding domain-containing protein n=1 Tax=Brucepastera parasyntrophica TaxID=2880008 RepID=UPI00210A511D|nr:DbpA RNA binding domain-containing protein [Brucepastera parasyntrophica]ULQ59077.1 DbpA RNA binding domain-containing protein [Brucepastera parasyntrophica]
MSKTSKNELNDEQVVLFLNDIVEKIRTEADPSELNKFRSLFRRSVPFSLRSYFAAYVLMKMNEGKFSGKFDIPAKSSRFGKSPKDRASRTKDRREGTKQGKPAKEKHSADAVKQEPRPVLPEDISTTLFISIGRNRRVFPRDILGLILQNVEMNRDNIGDIRILDNYSFVQVLIEDAPKIIEALDNYEYRGRKLAVNFSRKKDELDDQADAEQADVSETEENSAES